MIRQNQDAACILLHLSCSFSTNQKINIIAPVDGAGSYVASRNFATAHWISEEHLTQSIRQQSSNHLILSLENLKWKIHWLQLIREYWTLDLFFFLFFLFRSASAAHGSSQARVESEPQLSAYTTATATRDHLPCTSYRFGYFPHVIKIKFITTLWYRYYYTHSPNGGGKRLREFK